LQGLDIMKVIRASAMVTLSQIFWKFASEYARSVYCKCNEASTWHCQYTLILNLVSNLQVLTVR